MNSIEVTGKENVIRSIHFDFRWFFDFFFESFVVCIDTWCFREPIHFFSEDLFERKKMNFSNRSNEKIDQLPMASIVFVRYVRCIHRSVD